MMRMISRSARLLNLPAVQIAARAVVELLDIEVLHVELPILAGHVIMGTDMLESMGHEVRIGNNTTISLELDSREEADRLFAALSNGGGEKAEMQDMPWGAYWGVCLDRFGIRWMFSFTEPSS